MSGSADLVGLVLRSSFIFAGTVISRGRSSLKALPPRPDLAIARLERALRINPMLGKLDGRPITVLLARDAEVQPGAQLLFFAQNWLHAEEIAVRAFAHLPAEDKMEQDVGQIVASLPERHLRERIASAVLIVRGVVKETERATEIAEPISEHAAQWMRAMIEVQEILKGEQQPGPRGRGAQPKGTVMVFFPGSDDRAYRNWPRLSSGQSAVFLLHGVPTGKPGVTPQRGGLPQGALIAPDPMDVQPPEHADDIRSLLGSPRRPR